uniref:ABC transporter domain-containing protein n=1 Tax=Cuerna arida TaxID=1464854 RepID=A0A1B6F783_9HEMI
MEEVGNAVTVRGAYKKYDSDFVLFGLDLTVRDGTIYGLLGPSGCGKTTLLRSIVGLMTLDAGEIYVKAGRKNNVGYMPQELGLYEHMTIVETFRYFGKLYGMKQEIVNNRSQDLVEFLDLPDHDRLVGSLSSGQQRRVSFAVAIIHNPDLLILDEPTVGIDPIISAAIWDRLLMMASSQQKTIILTTHYIEEARKADMIGLMRDGVLPAEESVVCRCHHSQS